MNSIEESLQDYVRELKKRIETTENAEILCLKTENANLQAECERLCDDQRESIKKMNRANAKPSTLREVAGDVYDWALLHGVEMKADGVWVRLRRVLEGKE